MVFISTHTLRGERDQGGCSEWITTLISTHTLRGERDANNEENNK